MQTRATLAGVAVVAALLATAGIAGAFATGDSPAQVQSPDDAQTGDTITVGASGQVQAQADRAVVDVAVVATGDDVSAVRDQLSTNASRMRTALAEQGINESQIRTSNYDISTNRRYARENGDQPEYSAVHSFAITVHDTGEVGQVVDTAVTNGANEVNGVEFTLSADRREELRQDALRSAMDSARSQASAIASQADLSVDGVDRVATTEYNRTPYAAETATAGDAAATPSTAIDSGPVSVSASITVVYDVQSS